jgi:uncharacterized membrane-anchored protein
MKGLMNVVKVLWIVAGLTTGPAGPAIASESSGEEQRQIQWVDGPARVDLGEKLAEMNIGEDYLFAGPEDTRLIMEYYGNPPTEAEMGIVVPKDENQNWFMVLEYFPVGYVRDDDRDEIDGDAILESYRKGTAEGNKQREKLGAPPLHITGWYEEPHYDEATHNLTWAMLAESEGRQVVNYNVRLLGRGGYSSAILVTDPDTLSAYKPMVDSMIANFNYKTGNSYLEYVQGDKVAQIGLTALVAGGAGAAAAKLGLFQALAKAWKAIFVGIAAFFTAIWRFIKGIFVSEDRTTMRTTPDS